MIYNAKVYANRVDRILLKDEKLQQEPKDQLITKLKQLFTSRNDLKQKVADIYLSKMQSRHMKGEKDTIDGATQDLYKEIYKNIGENSNYENFINSISYALGEIMQMEMSDNRPEKYFEKLDR